MSLKSAIKKAITENSKYKVIKVWSVEFEPSNDYTNGPGHGYLNIEVSVKKRNRKQMAVLKNKKP